MNGRITPDKITELGPFEIFVFGSNLSGIHGAGAARQAYEMFGAKWGDPLGLQGNSFAIPTKDRDVKTSLPLFKIEKCINIFLQFVENAPPDRTFYITEIGCGYAGFIPSEIAPYFKTIKDYANVYLPASFWNIIKNDGLHKEKALF